MLDITVVCPHCGATVLIPKESFEPTMPVYDENEMESLTMCDCGLVQFVITIALEAIESEDGDDVEGLTIGNVRIEPILVSN